MDREALKEQATIAEIAVRFSINPNQVSEWKKQALEGLADIFTGKVGRNDAAHEVQIKELHAKIGQLTVEREFLDEPSVDEQRTKDGDGGTEPSQAQHKPPKQTV